MMFSFRTMDDNGRFVRLAGTEIQILSLVVLEDGRVELTFFVVMPSGALAADSLRSIVDNAAMPNGVLAEQGITVEQIRRPSESPTIATESKNSHTIILGVLLGAAVCITIVGTLVFLTLAW